MCDNNGGPEDRGGGGPMMLAPCSKISRRFVSGKRSGDGGCWGEEVEAHPPPHSRIRACILS